MLDLGLSPSERESCVDDVIQRFRRRQNNVTHYMLQAVESPRVLDFIARGIDAGELRAHDEIGHLLGTIAHTAKVLPGDEAAADSAAWLVRRIYAAAPEDIAPRFAITRDLLSAINSRHVGEIFEDLFLGLGTDVAKRDHALYVQSLRMQESIMPRQLDGMTPRSAHDVAVVLKSALLIEQENTGPDGSLLYDAKKAALWAALAFEIEDALEWLPTLLDHEPNPYVQSDLMETYACFRLEPLPARIRELVSEQRDIERHGDAGEWIVRTAALRVLRSAATPEAFSALLYPGFTLGGTVLLDTVQALGDAAMALTVEESQRGHVAHGLLESFRSQVRGPAHSASVHALLAIATAGRLPEAEHASLLEAAFTEGQEDFDQSRLLQAVVVSGATFPEVRIAELMHWADERHDRVGEMALEALIRLGRLRVTPQVAARLGVTMQDGVYRWSTDAEKMSRWAPYYITLLFDRSEEPFLTALLDIIANGSWKQAVQALRLLVHFARDRTHILPPEIGRTLVDRLRRRISPTEAELGLFSAVARIAPEQFLAEDWQDVFGDWFVDARIEFAEAIRHAMKDATPDARTRARSYLVRLAQDSQYGVRRATHRALAESENSTLRNVALTWLRADRHEPRVWAAEATAWITCDPDSECSEALSQLSLDEHKMVRRAYSKSIDARRQRQWVADYLQRVGSLHSPTNSEMLTVWRYGWALSRLADDDALHALERIRDDNDRAPNVRHFVSLLCKAAEKHWNETTKGWPDPIYPLGGKAETGHGALILGDKEWAIEYILWEEPPATPLECGTWGGSCRPTEAKPGPQVFGRECQIRTQNGRTGRGLIHRWPNMADYEFKGNGAFPA